MALLDAAKINKGYLTVLVDHRINREKFCPQASQCPSARHAGDFHPGCNWQPGNVEDPGGMQDPDRILIATPGATSFLPPE